MILLKQSWTNLNVFKSDILFSDFSLMTTPVIVGTVVQFVLFGSMFLNVLKNCSIYGLLEVLIKLFSTIFN